MKKIVKVSAILGACALAGVGITKCSVPSQVDKTYINSKFSSGASSYVCKDKVCDVYLLDHELKLGIVTQKVNIGFPEEYTEVRQLYDLAPHDVKIRLHLAGPGGTFNGLLVLVYSIKHSKADTTSIVEDDVASADAVLAVSSKHLEVSDVAYVMFHRASIYGTDPDKYCADDEGQLDRGQDAKVKCVNYLNSVIKKDEDFFTNVLRNKVSLEDFERIMKGEDVYVRATEVKDRFDGKVK